jgi:biotin carboxyl carrier protein
MTYNFKYNDQVYRISLEEDEKKTHFEFNGKKVPVEYQKIDNYIYSIILEGKSLCVGVRKNGKKVHVFFEGDLIELEAISERQKSSAAVSDSGAQVITSPMPSRVVKILKKVGDDVQAGEGVIVVEAMKMESELKSNIEGKVTEIKVEEGDAVESGTALVTLSSE